MAQELLTHKAVFQSPLPADLVSIVAAATPANGALTIAAQPVHARKLQVRAVVGTTTTTAITGGVVTLSGNDQDGNPISETISIVTNATATFKSVNAYSGNVTASLAGYTAAGSGTGNTLGIGVSNDFGVPTGINPINFALAKATKRTCTITGGVTAIAWVAADDVASTATVDATARTVAPTTAPNASGLIDYEFTVAFSTSWLGQ